MCQSDGIGAKSDIDCYEWGVTVSLHASGEHDARNDWASVDYPQQHQPASRPRFRAPSGGPAQFARAGNTHSLGAHRSREGTKSGLFSFTPIRRPL